MQQDRVVKVPDIGDVTDIHVIEILVARGDQLDIETPLLTLESDKATMDVPSPIAGTVTEVMVACLLYTSPSPRDGLLSRMPSSA